MASLKTMICVKGHIMKLQPSYLANGECVYVPDTRIKTTRPEYVYHTCKGFSGSVVVEDTLEAKFIGWMSVDDLPGGPYENARKWMKANKIG